MKIINILGREGVDAVYHSYHSYHANRSQGRRKSESYCWRRRFFCAAFLFSTSHKSVCSVKIPRHVLPFESLVWLEFHARGWIVLPNQVALTVSVRSLKLQFHYRERQHSPTIPAFPRETPITGSDKQQEAVSFWFFTGVIQPHYQPHYHCLDLEPESCGTWTSTVATQLAASLSTERTRLLKRVLLNWKSISCPAVTHSTPPTELFE